MKYILIIALFPFPLIAQTTAHWRSDYDHFEGSYEEDYSYDKIFTRKEKKLIKKIPSSFYAGSLSVTLSAEKLYSITISLNRLVADSLTAVEYEFKGTYTVDSLGIVTLNDKHPFSSNIIEIKEIWGRRNGEKKIMNRVFYYRFDDEFNWITDKKEHTSICDGCNLYPNY